VISRGTRYFLIALAALAAAACTRLAYDNASPLLTWMVDGYVDLHHEQKDWLRKRLDRALAWHRASELPEYRRFLADIARRSEGAFTEAEVEQASLRLHADYDRVVEHILPDTADFLLSLDDRQLERLERKFAKDDEKLAQEMTEGTEEKRRVRSVKRMTESVEEWIGELDGKQRALVAAREAALPSVTDDRLAERAYRQRETLALTRTRDRAKIIAGLHRLLVDTDSWRRAGYAAKIRTRNAATFHMIAALSTTLTARQRAHLQRRIRGYIDDIDNLAQS
jgi:hypothetical protein